MSPTEYLKRPYGRFVVPESDGTFRAEIIEFPGCIATGDTAAEALASLEDVAESWLEATLAKGQKVPEPIENVPFSGKILVRLPKSLHKKASHQAAREGISLNQFIVTSLAEQVGVRTAPLLQWMAAGTVNMKVAFPVGFPMVNTPPRRSGIGQEQKFTSAGSDTPWGYHQIKQTFEDANAGS